MQHKYTYWFRRKRTSVREKRLCFDKNAPSYGRQLDELLGMSSNEVLKLLESNERQKETYEMIEKILRHVIAMEGSEELKLIAKDPNHMKRIAAFVRKEGGRLRWLPPTSLSQARKFDERFKSPEDEYNTLKLAMTGEINDLLDRVEAVFSLLDAAKKDYPNAKSFDHEKIKDMLETLSDKDLLQQRQDALVEIGRAVIDAKDEEELKESLNGTFARYQKMFDKELGSDPALALVDAGDYKKDLVDKASFKVKGTVQISKLYKDFLIELRKGRRLDTRKKAMLEMVIKAAEVSLSAEAIKRLKEIRTKIDIDLGKQQKGITQSMNTIFERQTRYLNSMALRHDHFIEDSVLPSTQQFDWDIFEQTLGILGVKDIDRDVLKSNAGLDKKDSIVIKDVDVLETQYGFDEDTQKALLFSVLTSGKSSIEDKPDVIKILNGPPKVTLETLAKDLVGQWNIDELMKYMREDLSLRGGIPDYVKGWILRSRLPGTVAEDLIEGDVSVRIADMVKIAKIEKLSGDTKLDNAAASALFWFTLENSPDLKTDVRAIHGVIKTKVLAHNADGNLQDKADLRAYLKIALNAYPDRQADALRLIDNAAPQKLDEQMLKRISGSIVERSHIFTVTGLSNAYREAVTSGNAGRISTTNKALMDFLKAHVTGDFATAKAKVTSPYDVAAERIFLRFMQSNRNIDLVSDRTILHNLSKEYKEAVKNKAPDKTAKKNALIRYLGMLLAPFPKRLATAKLFVIDKYDEAAEKRLFNKLEATPTVFDPTKGQILWKKILDYQSSIGNPDEGTKSTALVSLLDAYLPTDQQAKARGMLDTSNKLSQTAAEKIIEFTSQRKRSGAEVFQEARFVEVMTYLFLDKARATETKASKREKAEERAKELWKELMDAGHIISSNSDDFVIVNKEAVQNAMMFRELGTQTIGHHKLLRNAKLHEVKWAETVKGYVGTLYDDSKTGANSWLEYIKNFGSVFSHTKDGGKLLEKMNKRRGLRSARKAVDTGLNMSGNMKLKMTGIIARMQQIAQDRDNPNTSRAAVSSIKEHFRDARILMKSYAYNLYVLKEKANIDSLPPDVQNTAVWIAMNRGTKKDPDQGLKEAIDFVNSYHRSPHRLGVFQQAHEAFWGRAQLPQGRGPTRRITNLYRESLADYQKVAAFAIDEKLYKALDDAVENLFLVMNKKGASADEVLAAKKAYDSAFKAYNDEVAKFESRKKGVADPSAFDREAFLSSYYAKHLSQTDIGEFLQFQRKFEVQREIEQSNNMDLLWHRHKLSIKPPAVDALAKARAVPNANVNDGLPKLETNLSTGAYSIDRWLTDGDRSHAQKPLDLILNGTYNPEGKDALIEAYIKRKDVPYHDRNGILVVMKAAEAENYVKRIQELLQMQSEGYAPSMKLRKQYENLFENPLDRGLRASIETMQDLWAGDVVDKAKVIAVIAVGIWLVKEIWKKGSQDGAGIWKIAKFGLVGLPILLFANSAYKQRTGRDILGEKMLFMPPQLRNSILEQWRRRSVKSSPERYGVLGHNAGIAAIEELTDEGDPIPVQQLIAWRGSIKENGKNDYSNKAPPGISISKIRRHLGANGTKEEALEIAFIAFEALCTDVSAIHGRTSGSIRDRANWGADYIDRTYVHFHQYDENPDVQAQLMQSGMTMTDVMHSEAPFAKNQALKVMTGLEKTEAFVSKGFGTIGSGAARGFSWLEFKRMQLFEAAPDMYDDTKEFTFSTAKEIYDWLRLTGEKSKKVLDDNFDTAIRAVSETVTSLGGYIIRRGPEAIEFVFDGSIEFTERVGSELKNVHDYLLTNPTLAYMIKPFERAVLRTFGLDLAELTTEQAKKQTEDELSQFASYLDGGRFAVLDRRRTDAYIKERTISSYEPSFRTDSIKYIDGAGGPEMSDTKVIFKLTPILDTLTVALYQANTGNTKFATLTPGQKRYVQEILEANLYKSIAKEAVAIGGEIFDKQDEYDKEKAAKERVVKDAEIDKVSKKSILESAEKRLKDIVKARTTLNKITAESAQLFTEFQGINANPQNRNTPQGKAQITRLREIAVRRNEILAEQADLNRLIATEATVKGQVDAASNKLKDAEKALEKAKRELNLFEDAGPKAAKLDLNALLANADPEALALSGGRKQQLFKDVFDEDRKLFFIPMEWMLADTVKLAEKQLKSWKQSRIEYDEGYQKHLKDGGDPAIRNSYERYLEQIGINEMFKRATMKSPDDTPDGTQHILHLSADEASKLDQYLREREGLATFKQFSEQVWPALDPKHRP